MAQRHVVKLMAPQFVKPYVKGSKTDAADAEAIFEAVSRPTCGLFLLNKRNSRHCWRFTVLEQVSSNPILRKPISCVDYWPSLAW